MRCLFPLTLLALAVPACALVLDEPDIGISKMIPKEGDQITWLVPVLNDDEEAFEGEVTVTMRFARRGERLGEPTAVTQQLALDPKASADFAFDWTAPENGYWRFVFEIEGVDQRVTRQLAVTKDDVHFVWFGAPKEFKWCNVPTTVKDEDEPWWLRRGAIPAHWKGGVCYKQWPVEKFVENWGASDWIAIDEVGGPGEITDKFIEAWKQLKQHKPDQFIAVWYMGAHHYWADVKDLVDLFVPEIYLNYRGNHLGQFDTYFRTAREAGVMDQVIPGLGINQIKDEKTGRITNSPTKTDVLRQFRYLKRTAPELKGIGFFTSGSAAWGVAEYADALCEEYYIKPVLTILNPDNPFRTSRKPPPDSVQPSKALAFEHWGYDVLGEPKRPTRYLSVTVKNVGNMDAEDVVVEWQAPSSPHDTRITRLWVDRWPVGETRTFALNATDLGDPVRFRILPDSAHTLLDGSAEDYLLWPESLLKHVFPVVIPPGPPSPVPLPLFVPADADGPLQLQGMTPQDRGPVAALPARPGTEERLVVLRMPARNPRHYRAGYLSPGTPKAYPAPTHSRKGNLLTVGNDFHEAKLDLTTDQLTSLGPKGGVENLFKSPWGLRATGHEGFGEAKLRELPGCLVVTIPYDSEQASGESQYVFFDYTPAIRIARSWIPKGEVILKGAGDRCGLFQKGGTYALQPGVGGPVRRGRLHDSSKYRDLLFGYLGDRPRPENSDKAGWIDFSYGAEDADGGLGVVIDYRWQDSDTKSYDVTRLYDASDWLEVLYLWGKEETFTRPQKSCIYLIPHRRMDFTDEAVIPPAKALWEQMHARQLAAIGE